MRPSILSAVFTITLEAIHGKDTTCVIYVLLQLSIRIGPAMVAQVSMIRAREFRALFSTSFPVLSLATSIWQAFIEMGPRSWGEERNVCPDMRDGDDASRATHFNNPVP